MRTEGPFSGAARGRRGLGYHCRGRYCIRDQEATHLVRPGSEFGGPNVAPSVESNPLIFQRNPRAMTSSKLQRRRTHAGQQAVEGMAGRRCGGDHHPEGRGAIPAWPSPRASRRRRQRHTDMPTAATEAAGPPTAATAAACAPSRAGYRCRRGLSQPPRDGSAGEDSGGGR